MNTARNHFGFRLLAFAVAAMLLPVCARAQLAEVPYLTGRITDNAEALTPDARARLDDLIKSHQETNQDQIAVLIMPALAGMGIEEYAAQVFQAWKLGDNGVLLVVAPGDRRVRIETGSDVKGKLSEVAANRIVRDLMAPRFQKGKFSEGIDVGVHAIVAQLEGGEAQEEPASADQTGQNEEFFEGPDLGISERILIGCFIFGIIGLFTAIGVVTPGVGWFLYVFLIPFWAMFPIIVVGTRGALVLLIIYLVGYPTAKIILKHKEWYRKAVSDLKSKGSAQIGGFTLRSGGSSATWSSS